MHTDPIIKVKFLPDDEIRKAADQFRSEICSPWQNPPIDSVFIADVRLGLNFIPIEGMFHQFHVDAALTPDREDLLVDKETFNKYDRGERWEEKRLRFSVAHELGHYVLHANELQNIQYGSPEEYLPRYRRWLGSRHQPDSPEYQADEFAGRFLVPLNLLEDLYDNYSQIANEKNPNWREHQIARSWLARRIAPRFAVSRQVIETRFDREGLWPVS